MLKIFIAAISACPQRDGHPHLCYNVPLRSNNSVSGFVYDFTVLSGFYGLTGGAECEVEMASEDELQCVVKSKEKTHVVTNQGSHHSRFTFPSFVHMSPKSQQLQQKPGTFTEKRCR